MSQLGDYVLPCCDAPAVPKTSINGVQFFSHLADECVTAPETIWHRTGKLALVSALRHWGLNVGDEVDGTTPLGDPWRADVLFHIGGRRIAIELQRSYQHLKDFIRRQERYRASGVECYWLTRKETFITLAKATSRMVLKRDYGNVFPAGGIGTGMLPELPVAMLLDEGALEVHFGALKSASVPTWLTGIIQCTYQFRNGSWNLG